jgi:hypothetical protein
VSGFSVGSRAGLITASLSEDAEQIEITARIGEKATTVKLAPIDAINFGEALCRIGRAMRSPKEI